MLLEGLSFLGDRDWLVGLSESRGLVLGALQALFTFVEKA